MRESGMTSGKQRVAALAPQVGDLVGPWRVVDRLIAWDDEDEGWSLDVWAIGADGDEGWTRVVTLAAMLDDPKAAAYLEIVLEETSGSLPGPGRARSESGEPSERCPPQGARGPADRSRSPVRSVAADGSASRPAGSLWPSGRT
jgi:hypothetical protein